MSGLHTPGPWEADSKIIGWQCGSVPACAIMFRTGPHSGSPIAWALPHSKTEFATLANARLIAAAPDLLFALEELLQAHERLCEHFDIDAKAEAAKEPRSAPALAYAAIAKATPTDTKALAS